LQKYLLTSVQTSKFWHRVSLVSWLRERLVHREALVEREGLLQLAHVHRRLPQGCQVVPRCDSFELTNLSHKVLTLPKGANAETAFHLTLVQLQQ